MEQFPGPNEKTTAKKLQKWCDQHLAAEHWPRLQNALRQHRRDLSQHRTVRLTSRAHELLTELAKQDQLTLSETLEKHLTAILNPPAPAPPPEPAKPAAKPVPSQPRLKRMADNDGWIVTVADDEIGRVYKHTIDSYPKQRTAWRAYRKASLLSSEYPTRKAAVESLIREHFTN